MSAILPVLTVITDATGAEIGDAQEIRIGAGLTVTLVTNDGPPRVTISATSITPSEVAPFSAPVIQPEIAAETVLSGGNTRTYLAFASVNAPSAMTGLVLIAGDSLTQHASNFATFSIWECSDAGAHVGAAKYSGTTQTGGATNPTGSWVAGTYVFDIGLGFDIAAGNSLVIEWDTSSGSGVAMPGGWYRVT